MFSKMDTQHFGIKPFTVIWLILLYSAVYYWDKPIQKSSYVGFALFFVLGIPFVSMVFTCFFIHVPSSYFSEDQNMTEPMLISMSFANYADCFTLRFVFNVRLSILWYIYIFENKYIYTFDFNNLSKMNTFNVIFGIEWLTLMSKPVVVHNYPSIRHDRQHFLVYIEHAHLRFKLCDCRMIISFQWAAETFYKVWPRLTSASVCNIYVRNGLLLHIEGCMILSVYKLETTMYYPF